MTEIQNITHLLDLYLQIYIIVGYYLLAFPLSNIKNSIRSSTNNSYSLYATMRQDLLIHNHLALSKTEHEANILITWHDVFSTRKDRMQIWINIPLLCNYTHNFKKCFFK